MYVLCVGPRITLLEEFPDSHKVSAAAVLYDGKDQRWYRIEQVNRRQRQWATCSLSKLKRHHLAAALLLP